MTVQEKVSGGRRISLIQLHTEKGQTILESILLLSEFTENVSIVLVIICALCVCVVLLW